MKQCQVCRGLVPEALSHCPNCAVAPGRMGKLAAGAALIGIIASGCGVVAMPVYGAPCTGKLPDGGTNCGVRNEPLVQEEAPPADADGR